MAETTWEVWDAIYPALSAEYLGLVGAMLSRAEAQVRRLAGLYALLDGVREIAPIHLLAALAVWQYCAASVCFVFGDAIGDPIADDLLRALRAAGPAGLTRGAMFDLFQRHRSAAEITRAVALLRDQHLAAPVKEATGGRPVERWVAIGVPPARGEKAENSEKRGAEGLFSLSSLFSPLAIARAVVARQRGGAEASAAGGGEC
jgi:hypothetical protein